jgi:DNA-binding Lrp family transcriptional regulator
MRRLDRTDRRIVEVLQNNARLSNKEVAAAVGIAPSTCSERLRRLEDDAVVRGYHAEVDPRVLGVGLRAVLSIRLRRHAATEVDTFWRTAAAMPEVIGLWHVAGATDFMVHVVVRDADHLRDLAVKSFTGLPEVAHIETSLVFAHFERGRLPDLLGE